MNADRQRYGPSYSYHTPRRINRRVYREIYWRRIILIIVLLSVIVCGVGLYMLYGKNAVAAKKHMTVPSGAYHYVYMGTYATMAEARSAAVSLRLAGGAGYILNDEAGFRTAAAVYKNRTDAVSVAARLKSEGIDAEVLTVQSEAFKIEIITAEAEARELAAYFSYLHELFDSVYRIGADLDGQKITESHAVLSLAALSNKVSQKHSELTAYIAYPAAAHIGRTYSALSELFFDALNFSLSQSAGGNIKYLLCGIADNTCRIKYF